MSQDNVLLELRFPQGAEEILEVSAAHLKSLDVEAEDTARDPSILAALTIAGAAVHLVTELVKLAKELKRRGEKRKIEIVKLDGDNKERSISLLEASEEELGKFVEGE